jgi:hypothetical protein
VSVELLRRCVDCGADTALLLGRLRAASKQWHQETERPSSSGTSRLGSYGDSESHERLGTVIREFRDVDPRELRVPHSRRQGSDPAKLARQISLFGRSAVGMPPRWVYEGSDGVLVLYNGVTRATRIAKLAPGTFIRVEVIGKLPRAFAANPKIGGLLP